MIVKSGGNYHTVDKIRLAPNLARVEGHSFSFLAVRLAMTGYDQGMIVRLLSNAICVGILEQKIAFVVSDFRSYPPSKGC